MNEQLMNLITQIILALLPILGTIITVKVIPLINAKTSDEDRKKVLFWVEIAVVAIEKHYEGSTENGTVKKDFVVDFLINKLHIDKYVTREQLSLIIDAVVEDIINRPQKEIEAMAQTMVVVEEQVEDINL